jgi:MFS family permease
MVCEQQAARYSDVFVVREFRAVFAAQLLSVIGDQFARVALSVLVFNRTGSPGLTALAYALTYLPDLFAGPLLAGIADRYPRRAVMVAADLARAILVALMALPGVPFPLVCALLVGVHALGAPFSAARAATLASILTGDRYLLGTGAADMVDQLAQVLGFVVGGLVIVGMGADRGLQIDAATFLVSAVIVRLGVHDRPVPAFPTVRDPVQPWWPSLVTGAVTVWTTPKLRALVMLACVAGFYVTIEALAVPYAMDVMGSEGAVGLLLAAGPAGAILGMWGISRLLPGRRLKLLGPLAVAACLPLALSAFRPSVPVMVALLVVSGVGSAYHMVARSAFVQSVPDHGRGQAFGLAVTALRTAQGTGLLLAGVCAETFGAPTVLSGAGITGTLVAAAASLTWYQARRRPR